eukprot:271853_1
MSSPINVDDQVKRIVLGFINTIQASLPATNNIFFVIPSAISNIIFLYVSNMFKNQGAYTWLIDDNKTVNDILNAKNGDKFESNPFKLAKLDCKLEIFPNGDNPDLVGYFVIYLRLLSLPIHISCIRFGRTFRVIECQSGASWLSTIDIQNYDYWTRKQPLAELAKINPKTITIKVEINIFKIILKEINTNIFENYRLQPIKHNYLLKQHLEYKLTEKEMNTFRTSINCKSMCTQMLNDMWCVQIYPAGVNISGAGNLSFFLQLLSFPENVDKIKVKYKIICHQVEEEYEDIDEFDENNFSSWGLDYFIESHLLYKCDEISFSVDVEILEMTSTSKENELEISDQAKISYLLST